MPGERGYDIAAVYVASQLQGLGLEPAGDGRQLVPGDDFPGRTDHRGPVSRWARPGGERQALVPGARLPRPRHPGHRRGRRHRAGGLRRLRHRRPGVPLGRPRRRGPEGEGGHRAGGRARSAPRPTSFPPFPARSTARPARSWSGCMARGVVGVLWVQTPAREKIVSFTQQVATRSRGSLALVENGLVARARADPPGSTLDAGDRTRCSPPPVGPSGWPRWSPPPSAASTRPSPWAPRCTSAPRPRCGRCTPPTCSGCGARQPGSPVAGEAVVLHRAPRPPGHREARGGRRHLQRRLGQRRRGGQRPGDRPRLHPASPAPSARRCSSPSSRARRRACSARSGWWPIRPCRATRWSPT